MINSIKKLFLFLIIFGYKCDCSFLNITAAPKTIECPNIRNVQIEDGGQEYCNCTYREFRRRYGKANLKLTSFIEKLRAWNCPQFKDECENRYFDFNRFTFLVYEKFCNNSNFLRICEKELESLQQKVSYSTSKRLRM